MTSPLDPITRITTTDTGSITLAVSQQPDVVLQLSRLEPSGTEISNSPYSESSSDFSGLPSVSAASGPVCDRSLSPLLGPKPPRTPAVMPSPRLPGQLQAVRSGLSNSRSFTPRNALRRRRASAARSRLPRDIWRSSMSPPVIPL